MCSPVFGLLRIACLSISDKVSSQAQKRVLSDANSDGQGIQHGCEMGGGLFSSEAVSNRAYKQKERMRVRCVQKTCLILFSVPQE